MGGRRSACAAGGSAWWAQAEPAPLGLTTRPVTGLVRMHAARKANLRPNRSQVLCPAVLVGVPGRQDAEHPIESGHSGPLDDRGQIFRKCVIREVAVRIEHQRTRVPGGGGGSSNRTSDGLPPSRLAASTIPFDSTPISLAGFKLATTTTVRPTRSSAS